MSFNKEIQNASLSQLICWWNGEKVPDWLTASRLVREKVASALRKHPGGVKFLKSRVSSEYQSERAKALWFLARKESCDDEIIRLLINAFRNTQGLEPTAAFAFKELALHGFIAVEQYPLDRPEVEDLLDRGDEGSAARAMVYLSYAFQAEAVAILRSGLRSSNPTMRGYACSEAGFRYIRELRGEVESLLRDTNDFVARSAQIGCEMYNAYDLKQQRT